jgi:hypothetical protein
MATIGKRIWKANLIGLLVLIVTGLVVVLALRVGAVAGGNDSPSATSQNQPAAALSGCLAEHGVALSEFGFGASTAAPLELREALAACQEYLPQVLPYRPPRSALLDRSRT